MGEKSILKITNRKQFERLVHLMQKNPQIGRGTRTFGQNKQQVEEQWNSFANELNSFGPPRRTSKEWQRVWINYKAKTKKKIIEEYSLSPLEQTVADLLHTELDVNPPGDSFDDPSSSEPSCSLQSSSFSSIKETTTDQFALLLREVEKTPELAKHTPAFGPYRNHEDWEKIAKKLNAIGPPERSMREWTKVFRNLKLNTKKKIEENEKAGYPQHLLSETEKAMGKILELIEAVKSNGETFGVPSDKSFQMITINKTSPSSFSGISEESIEKPPSPTTNCTTGAQKRKTDDLSSFLFRRQLQNQVKYMKISKDMMQIMDRQSICLNKLTNAVERQEELMERQLKLLEKQTLAIERQAAALERMAEL